MENKYFKFPLSLMQLIKNDTDKNAIAAIIGFSVQNMAGKVKVDLSAIAKQIQYLFYSRPWFLPYSIKTHLEDMFDNGSLSEDETYHGFVNGSFEPEEENTSKLVQVFKENKEFFSDCTQTYGEHQVCELLNIKPEFLPQIRDVYPKTRKHLESFEKKYGADAWTGIKTDLLFSAFNGELSMDLIRLILAVQSVTGKQTYNLSYKSVLMPRMFGCKKTAILNDLFNKNPELKEKYESINKRRQWERLLSVAVEGGYISHYCTGRQFFVSISLNVNELKAEIMKRKNQFQISK